MLPEGMAETLAPSSWVLEDLRRKLLDHYRAAGFELILTPLVEHLESLLTGSAEDLERQTFKLIDPESGRLLGLRADMTPQAARVAARHYAQQKIVRLCYLGTVLRATAPGARAVAITAPGRLRNFWRTRSGGRPRSHQPDAAEPVAGRRSRRCPRPGACGCLSRRGPASRAE